MSKMLVSAAVLAATMGTCTTRPTPPPPSQNSSEETAEKGDRWEGLPEECQELAEPCDDCDRVEQMRRDILAKKCVPVCDAYMERRAEITSSLPREGIDALEADDVCGKEGTKCSPLEESACGHAVDYVGAGEAFREFWESPEQAPPGAELIARFHAEFLSEYLDAHVSTLEWAEANDLDPTPVLKAGGQVMDASSAEVITGFRAEVSSEMKQNEDQALTRKYEAIVALIELVREPGELDTWSRRRADLEKTALGGTGL